MIAAYIDSSVVLRIVLEQDKPLREWNWLEIGLSSHLLSVECHRTLERLWRERQLDDSELELKRSKVDTIMNNVDLLELDANVVTRAAKPFAAYVATLDALHLATAILYRDTQPDDERPILFATHDVRLAKAAEAMHFDVIGVPL